MKIGIAVSQYNKKISDGLRFGALAALEENAVSPRSIYVVEVPGAFEIPLAALRLIEEKKCSGVIALGCVIEGETDHYRAVCDGVTYGIQKVAIEKRVPVMLGVLMCKKKALAVARSGKIPRKNKGYECAAALFKMLRNL